MSEERKGDMPMLQWIITGVVVLICVFFWLKKIMPKGYNVLCLKMAGFLKHWGILPHVQKRLERQSLLRGCGSCKSCDHDCH